MQALWVSDVPNLQRLSLSLSIDDDDDDNISTTRVHVLNASLCLVGAVIIIIIDRFYLVLFFVLEHSLRSCRMW